MVARRKYNKEHSAVKVYGDYRKGSVCEICGFEAVHPCQLDIDHIDENRNNNATENLRTICSNCHRLKSHHNTDKRIVYKKKNYPKKITYKKIE